jgi:hypothetical protein
MASIPLRAASKDIFLSDDKRKNSVQEVLYQPVATEDPHKAHWERRAQAKEKGIWGVQLLDNLCFQNFIGLVICANGVVIGMETDMPHLTNWSPIENGFLVFFFIELCFKLGIEGCYGFFHHGHPDFWWNVFDCMIITVGVVDTAVAYMHLTGTGGYATLFRMVRLMRILRLVRLLKFLKRLYLLAMGLVEAAKAIFWVTILMCFVLYVCAIVLVHTVGRTHPTDVHFDFLNERFGSIAQAMITLFVLMSSPNLPVYQDEMACLKAAHA